MSTAAESAAKPGGRRGRFLVVLTLMAMALITVLVLGGSYALHAYDRSNVISVTCTVTAAKGDVGSSSSGKGIGSSFEQVEISTRECGPLVLRRGVTAENKEATAGRLEAGGRTRFEIGAASFRFRKALVSVRERVVVFGFREQPRRIEP